MAADARAFQPVVDLPHVSRPPDAPQEQPCRAVDARVGVVAVSVEHTRQSVLDPRLIRGLQGAVGQGQKQGHAGRRVRLAQETLREQIRVRPEVDHRLNRLGLHTRVRREDK